MRKRMGPTRGGGSCWSHAFALGTLICRRSIAGDSMKILSAVCGFVSAIAVGLWQWSGAEIYTKSGKAITESQRDAFGDVQEVIVMRPGPLGGYYLGLDVVAVVVAASLATVGTVWLVRRVRSRTQGVADHAS